MCIRRELYARLVRAKERNEYLNHRMLSEDLKRSLSTVHHHVSLLRQAGFVQKHRLLPAGPATELPRELWVGHPQPALKHAAMMAVKTRKRKPKLTQEFDRVLDMFGDLPSGVAPQFEAAWDALLDLRERFKEAGF